MILSYTCMTDFIWHDNYLPTHLDSGRTGVCRATSPLVPPLPPASLSYYICCCCCCIYPGISGGGGGFQQLGGFDGMQCNVMPRAWVIRVVTCFVTTVCFCCLIAFSSRDFLLSLSPLTSPLLRDTSGTRRRRSVMSGQTCTTEKQASHTGRHTGTSHCQKPQPTSSSLAFVVVVG
ncbi:hypothetical protein IWX48DRAFT_212586 [Phyllosticta citricarpa]